MNGTTLCVSVSSHASLWVTHIFQIQLNRWKGRQILHSKQNIFVFTVDTHVCPPLWLTNTDIRLVVCTAWVMRHQSDLQNSRGGAINHIGSGINHYVEDIFCHRCPLTITLHKMLSPSLLPSILLFLHRSISHQSDQRLVSRGRKRRERCPFHYLFKMQVKVYRHACAPAIWNAFQQREQQETMKTLTSRPLFLSQPPPSW